MKRYFEKALWAAASVAMAATSTLGQVVADAIPIMSGQGNVLTQSGYQPAGPADLLQVVGGDTYSTFSTDPRDSVFNNLGEMPEGGWQNLNPGPGTADGIRQGTIAGDGGNSRFIDQPLDCVTGYFSNNNSNVSPYLAFDDFRAGSEPLRNVRFYGGVYGGSFSLNAVSSITVQIFTLTSGTGDLCGWTYGTFVAQQQYTLAELNPTYVCTGDFYDTYQFDAGFSSPIALNPGQVYMITIYATLVDPNAGDLFTWNQSTVSNYNDATSWDRGTGAYIRCGPDQAFTTNVNADCFELDCEAPNCYFSNTGSNSNPFIVADDFTASSTGDLRQLQFVGGGFDVGTFQPALLGNTAGFYIELYTIAGDQDAICDSTLTSFLGAYQVSMADARPVYRCTDLFGIPQYEFTVSIPASVYPLTEGQNYAVGVYGIPADPNGTEIFCWALTDGIYGFTSWSYNTDTAQREVCHEADQAFCVNGRRPCLGDFNMDGTRNTQDVLAFLNAWNARHPSADINGDGVINTQDVLLFLNRWNVPC